MPLFFEKNINDYTRLAIWHIAEEEAFFLKKVSLITEIKNAHKRRQHLAGRYLLSYLFPDFPQKNILIAGTRKPYLKNEMYHFSISHCGDYAAAIVSKDKRVGIDTEQFSPKVLRIKHKFLNQKEIDFLPDDQEELNTLTLLWSAKESVYKWWSFGGVDFRKNMLLHPFKMLQQGSIQGLFIKNDQQYDLNVMYQFFDSIVLTYVFTNDLNDWGK